MFCISYLFCLDTAHTVHLQGHRLPSEKAFLLIIFSFLHFLANYQWNPLYWEAYDHNINPQIFSGPWQPHTTRNMLRKSHALLSLSVFALAF